jgi:integrase
VYGHGNYYDDIVILLGTGLRVSELYGLTKNDINFKTRCIYIDHQLCRTVEKPYFVTTPKTNSDNHTIPMTDTVYLTSKRLIKNRPPPKVELLVDRYSNFLFLDKSGMPTVAMHLESYMRGAQSRVNRIYGKSFPRVTPHVLRHVFCTNMQQAGIDVKSLQYLMGHSNVGVTLDIYTYTDFDAVREAFSKAATSL